MSARRTAPFLISREVIGWCAPAVPRLSPTSTTAVAPANSAFAILGRARKRGNPINTSLVLGGTVPPEPPHIGTIGAPSPWLKCPRQAPAEMDQGAWALK